MTPYSTDYRVQIINTPTQLPAAWDALLAQHSEPTPFMQREYLSALHSSASATQDTGWQPHFVLLWTDTGQLAAACPLYIKHHSQGEFVFDHNWAQAYAQHGLDYYPKLVCAVPFTPVQGTRLMAIDDAARIALLAELQSQAQRLGASGVHLLFDSAIDQAVACSAGWALRQTVQFHWRNEHPLHPNGFADFESFLKTLEQSKAKKARAEMRKVRDAGVRWRYVLAEQASAAELQLLIRCYTQTYHEHGHSPYLSPVFFETIFRDMPQHWLLCIASHRNHSNRNNPNNESQQNSEHDSQQDNDFACSLIALDPAQKVAYGRYWGALARVDSLHFDACYYQPLQWCIANGYARFEGGAQGQHKMARGLLPVLTHSAHYIAHPQFAKAIAAFTQREQLGMQGYLNELIEHSPLRA